jgi:predicted thioesterase
MSEFSKFAVGEKHVFQKKITEVDAAHNYGTKRLSNLLATPALMAMVIEASVGLIDQKLSEGIISIGIEMGITHKKPTKVGETVTLELVVEELRPDDECIFLSFKAFDEIGQVAEGVHVRNVVNRNAFFEKVDERIEPLHIES